MLFHLNLCENSKLVFLISSLFGYFAISMVDSGLEGIKRDPSTRFFLESVPLNHGHFSEYTESIWVFLFLRSLCFPSTHVWLEMWVLLNLFRSPFLAPLSPLIPLEERQVVAYLLPLDFMLPEGRIQRWLVCSSVLRLTTVMWWL